MIFFNSKLFVIIIIIIWITCKKGYLSLKVPIHKYTTTTTTYYVSIS